MGQNDVVAFKNRSGTEVFSVDQDGNVTAAGVISTTGTDDFGALGIKADIVAESTAAAGVTVDGCLVKDGGATLQDSTTYFTDNTTPTKKLQVQCSGISAATTRTWTAQDVDGTVYVSGGTDVPVADGGTGASTAAGARTNLGLAIGTDVQAYDATLQSLSALGTAGDKLAYTTDVDTWAEAALTAAGRAILDDADATAQRATLGLVIGTDVQAYDAELAALAAASTGLVFPDIAAGAEVGNAIPVTVQLKNMAGVNVARVQRLHCRLYDASMLEALVASFTLAETGAGTEISTTARPALLIDTDANGAATVTITDVSGVFVGTVYLEVIPVIVATGVEPGVPAIIAATFA